MGGSPPTPYSHQDPKFLSCEMGVVRSPCPQWLAEGGPGDGTQKVIYAGLRP